MEIFSLDKSNIAYYEEYIGEDLYEKLENMAYHGFVAEEDLEAKAGIIWRYGEENKSIIVWFKLSDREAAKEVLDAYDKSIQQMNVKESDIVIPVAQPSLEKELLKEEGFRMRLSESDDIIVTLSELSAMPLMKDRKIPEGVKLLSEVTEEEFKKGISRCVAAGKTGLCENIEDIPKKYFDEDVSTCYVNRNGEITGFILFHVLPSQMLSFQLMVCLDKDVKTVLPGMMRLFVSSMEEYYYPDVKIILNRHNEASMLLSEKLLPRGFGIPVYVGNREENH